MRKPWKRLTINLSEENYRDLRLVASFNQVSMGEFVREVVATVLEANAPLIKLYKQAEVNEAKPSEP